MRVTLIQHDLHRVPHLVLEPETAGDLNTLNAMEDSNLLLGCSKYNGTIFSVEVAIMAQSQALRECKAKDFESRKP